MFDNKHNFVLSAVYFILFNCNHDCCVVDVTSCALYTLKTSAYKPHLGLIKLKNTEV